MYMNPFADLVGWLRIGRDPVSRIFVSYRREDARGDAGRLTDNLKARFGEKQIFRDVEAIEPGVDFVEAINKAVGASTVLLAIIGPNWLKVTDPDGRRRLDDPNDFVRLEIAAALNRNIRVVPVLVGGATMPKAEELPASLEAFARRQAHELSDPRWEFDVGQLMEALEKLGISSLPKPQDGGMHWWRKNRIAVGVGGTLLVVAGYLYSEFEDQIDELFSRSTDMGSVMRATVPETEVTRLPRQSSLSVQPPKPPRGAAERRSPVREAPARLESREPVRRALSYHSFDAIGRYPAVVQVFNPG